MAEVKLKFLELAGRENGPQQHKLGLYECICGTKKVLRINSVKTGNTSSCGCTQYKRGHGLYKSKEYQIWASMKDRCNNPNNPGYFRYGGRGIKVCERWNTFGNFIVDMGLKPTGTSLDRIDNNRNYEPSNCRWASTKVQQNNKRDTVLIEYGGLKMPLQFWAHKLGMSHITLATRLKRGWTIQEAIETPVQKRSK